MTGRTRWEIAQHEWEMDRWTAEAVDCPRCGALGRDEERDIPAQHCRNGYTDAELRAPAHPQRLSAAREVP